MEGFNLSNVRKFIETKDDKDLANLTTGLGGQGADKGWPAVQVKDQMFIKNFEFSHQCLYQNILKKLFFDPYIKREFYTNWPFLLGKWETLDSP